MTELDTFAYSLYQAHNSKHHIEWQKWEYLPNDEKTAWRNVASLAKNKLQGKTMTTKKITTTTPPAPPASPTNWSSELLGLVGFTIFSCIIISAIYYNWWYTPSRDQTFNYSCTEEQLLNVEKRLKLCSGTMTVEVHNEYRTYNTTPYSSKDTSGCYKDAIISSCTYSPVK